ncbi:unnamed protein product, partial [Rotaria socialis]
YVKAKLIRPAASSINVGDGKSTVNASDIGPLLSYDILMRTSCNPAYSEIPKRHASYATWPIEDLPPVDDLNTQEPMNQKIRTVRNDVPNTNAPSLPPTTDSPQLLISDARTLWKFVTARLDLPISQRLLEQNFKLSIIERYDDFESECDLHMVCLILCKQIEHINDVHMCEQTAPVPNPARTTVTEMTTSSESSTNESLSSKPFVESISKSATSSTKTETKTTELTGIIEDRNQLTPSNPCVICLTEKNN